MPLKALTAGEALNRPTVVYNHPTIAKSYGAHVIAVHTTRPAAPSAPTVVVNTTGGTIASGVGLVYSTTAVKYGVESLPSAGTAVQTTSTATSSATFTIATIADPEVRFYNVYGRTGGSQLFIMTVDTAVTTSGAVDTGAVTPSGAVPAGTITSGTASLRVPRLPGGTRSYQKTITVAAPATTIGEAGKYEYRRVGS